MARKRLLFALSLFLGVPALLAFQSQTESQESGVLIGVRSVGKGTKYHTLWITVRGGTARIDQLPGLLVPRNRGFSWAGHYFTLQKWEEKGETSYYDAEPASFEEHVWIRPAEDASNVSMKAPRQRVLNDDDTDRYCAVDSTAIAYIGPQYVSFEGTESSTCGQNPAPFVSYDTWLLDDLSGVEVTGHAVSVATLLDPNRQRAIERDREAAEAAMDTDCQPGGDLGAPMWTISHREGRWTMKGWQPSAIQCGGGTEYEIHADPPESLVRPESLPFAWKEVIAKVPNAMDAVASPRNDVLVAMTCCEVLMFRVRDGELGQVLSKFPLPVSTDDPSETHHTVVMDQWALGRYVMQWDKEVQRQKALRTSDQPRR